MDFKYVKIAVYVPVKYADKIREVMNENGAGRIGNYDYCSFSVKGTGRFRGNEKSNPFIGGAGQIETVEEERIETICETEKMEAVISALIKAHPYEEPAIDVYPLFK